MLWISMDRSAPAALLRSHNKIDQIVSHVNATMTHARRQVEAHANHRRDTQQCDQGKVMRCCFFSGSLKICFFVANRVVTPV